MQASSLPSFFSLLLIACSVGAIGVLAWVTASETGLAKFFRTGPALLIPVVYLWAIISHNFCPHGMECHDLWRTLPFYAAIGIAVLWHVALIVHNKGRSGSDWVYAIIFVPTFYLFCVYAMIIAIKAPL
jgi:hypothetical protein